MPKLISPCYGTPFTPEISNPLLSFQNVPNHMYLICQNCVGGVIISTEGAWEIFENFYFCKPFPNEDIVVFNNILVMGI